MVNALRTIKLPAEFCKSTPKLPHYTKPASLVPSQRYCTARVTFAESVVEVEAGSSDDDDEDDDCGVTAVTADSDELEPELASSQEPKTDVKPLGSEASQKAPAAAASSGHIKCVMCGKQFVHQANLRMHLKVHLGAKAQLKSCQACDRYTRRTHLLGT